MMTNLDNARAQAEALATATGKNLAVSGRCSEALYFAKLNAELTAKLRDGAKS